MTPTISVVIPVYNAEAFVAEAIESAQKQSLPPTEIIVVDDGSTDGSLDVVRQFTPAVQVIQRQNGGIGAARNSALPFLTGEFLAFLDADDVWPPDRLALLSEPLLRDPTLDGATGSVVEFGEAIVESEPTPGSLASSMLLRRTSFERVGPFREDIRMGEFIDWYARARDLGMKFGAIDNVVLRRRLHETNTGRLQREHRPDYVRVLRAALARRREAEKDA